MSKKQKRSRRDFLKRSGAAATVAAVGIPGSLMVPSTKLAEAGEVNAIQVTATGFPPDFAYQSQGLSRVWEYASMEARCEGVPVWSFSNLCYIYEAGPQLVPGLVMQEGNARPVQKIKLKKSWEIKYNLCGAESEMTCHTAYNDSQPMLPLHLIDGDPETVWSSWGLLVPDSRPEWIRIDLPVETEISSVALICAQNFRSDVYGKALPKNLVVKISRDALKWQTVYSNEDLPDQPTVEVKFEPQRAKQIWIIGENFPKPAAAGGPLYVFSIGSVEVRDAAGTNLALVSRGASVTVSSVNYLEINDRFTEDALWAPLNYDMGNKWLRIGGDNGSFMWHYVEHEKGKLELDPRGDYSVTDCARHGVDVIVNLDFKGNYIYDHPPRKLNWLEARYREPNDTYNDWLMAADANPEMFQAFIRYIEYMAGKLKDRVAYLELGNEWDGWFGADHYVKAFFEPMYAAVKRAWPQAKIMMGSLGGFNRNAILDCLGRKRRHYGLANGKLQLNASESTYPGALAVRNDINAADVTVTAQAEGEGTFGIALRYREIGDFLGAVYSSTDHTIAFREYYRQNYRHQNSVQALKKVPSLGPAVKLVAAIQGRTATFTVSDGNQSVSTSYEVKFQPNPRHFDATLWRKTYGDPTEFLMHPGSVGLMQLSGPEPQLFSDFEVRDPEGKLLAQDNFRGADGTIPPGWTYVNGGPNPISPGIGARVDAISWHPGPGVDPDGKYFSEVRELQHECRELGFKGEFFANEIYAGSMYPPGPESYPMLTSEVQMAKYLIRSLVGHNGLGMEAGPCHPAFTGRVHPQALCQATWGTSTLHPCRPTITYYMWRNVATLMDEFRPSEFAVSFSDSSGLIFFTFRRGERDRLLCVWIDGHSGEAVLEHRTDIVVQGVTAHRAVVADIMNGTEQELTIEARGRDTVVSALRVKDYPVFIVVTG